MPKGYNTSLWNQFILVAAYYSVIIFVGACVCVCVCVCVQCTLQRMTLLLCTVHFTHTPIRTGYYAATRPN